MVLKSSCRICTRLKVGNESCMRMLLPQILRGCALKIISRGKLVWDYIFCFLPEKKLMLVAIMKRPFKILNCGVGFNEER